MNTMWHDALTVLAAITVGVATGILAAIGTATLIGKLL